MFVDVKVDAQTKEIQKKSQALAQIYEINWVWYSKEIKVNAKPCANSRVEYLVRSVLVWERDLEEN